MKNDRSVSALLGCDMHPHVALQDEFGTVSYVAVSQCRDAGDAELIL